MRVRPGVRDDQPAARRGTDHLLAAAAAAGARRFIAQSYTGRPNARSGGPVKDEEDPLDPSPRSTAVSLASTTSSTTSQLAWLNGCRSWPGEVDVSMMTQIRGSSNANAMQQLGWEPAWPSWRRGFRGGLRA